MKQDISLVVYAPQIIFSDKKLSGNAKWILVEILNLFKLNRDHCWASNEHFADMFGLTKANVSFHIQKIEDLGWIKSVAVKNCDLAECTLKDFGWHRHIRPGVTLSKILDSLSSETGYPIKNTGEPPIKSTRITSNTYKGNIENNKENIVSKWATCPVKNNLHNLLKEAPNGHAECDEYIRSIEVERKRGFASFNEQMFKLHDLLKAGYAFSEIDRLISRVEKKFGKNNWDFDRLVKWADKEDVPTTQKGGVYHDQETDLWQRDRSGRATHSLLDTLAE